MIIILYIYVLVTYRLDIEQYRKEGVIVLTWTVNDVNEQRHFSDVLRIAYMKDVN